MTEEQVCALFKALEAKQRQAKDIAANCALDFVRTGKPEDRQAAQGWLRAAELWQEAITLLQLSRSLPPAPTQGTETQHRLEV